LPLLRATATLAAVLTALGCGQGLSDLGWHQVTTVGFSFLEPQHAEPGERVRTTVAFEVSPSSRVTGIEVDAGLSVEFYDTGACGEDADSVEEGRMELCLTLCVLDATSAGLQRIEIHLVGGEGEAIRAEGNFHVLDDYGDGVGVCG